MKRKKKKSHPVFTHKGPKNITFAVDFDLTAAAAADDQGDRKPPTFKGTAYTGGPMRVAGWYLPVIVDLAGMTVTGATIAILKNHDPNQIVGHATPVIGKSIKLAGVVSGTGPAAEEVVGNSQNGFPWKMSLGASVQKMEYIPEKASAKVNGRTFRGPGYVARETNLGESSFVPVGADQKTAAKVAAMAAVTGGHDMNFETWVKAKGFDVADLSAEQTATLQAAFDAEMALAAAGDGTDDAGDGAGTVKPAVKADATADIQAAMVTLKAETEASLAAIKAERREGVLATLFASDAELKAQAIKEDWSEVRCKNEIELKALRADRPQTFEIRSGGASDAPDQGAVLEASMLMSSGMQTDELKKHYKEKVIDAAVAGDNRGAGIHQAMYLCLAAAGMSVRPGSVTDSLLAQAWKADAELNAAAAGNFSTVSLSGILNNVAAKSLLAGFTATEVTALQLADITSVNDFKVHTRYSIFMSGDLKVVPDTGELQMVSLDEDSYTNQAQTMGALIGLGRQMIINDDLGAFTRIATMYGMKYGIAIDKAFWTMVLGNSGSFFSSDNGNYNAGATASALGSVGYKNATKLLRQQKNGAGDFISLPPVGVVVPPELEEPALELFVGRNLVGPTTAKNIAENIYANRYTPTVVPYLSDSSISGSSTTGWYMNTNPALMSAGEIAFLNGQRNPTIEMSTAPFDTLGRQWRVFGDFGVAQAEKRAWVFNTGANPS